MGWLRARLGREDPEAFRLTWSSHHYRLYELASEGQLLCRKCGRPIKPGDLIVYRGRTRRGEPKVYHARCWERLWH